MKKILSFSLFLILLSLVSFGQEVTPEWLRQNYSKKEVMIPMRDGISLSTVIYEPLDGKEHPIILSRTPYGIAPYGEGYMGNLSREMSEFSRNRYIIVYQSVRGTFLSEGEFMNIRPVSKDGSPDEVTDTYDTIEYLVKNTDNNDSVGIKGVSYPGFYSTLASLCGHPALKAVSPQAPVTDWWKGDDVHHNGVFMLADMYSFGLSFFRRREAPTTNWQSPVLSIDDNIYPWYLAHPDFISLTEPLGEKLPFWDEILTHPDYDSFWEERSPLGHLSDVKPAILVVGGEFDAEDCWGALATYKAYASLNPRGNIHFIYGPWPHGGWREVTYHREGIPFTMDGSFFGDGAIRYFIEDVEYPFFAYYLEGKGERPSAVEVIPSVAAGSVEEYDPVSLSKKYSSWPPRDATTTLRMYLGESGTLSETAPSGRSSFDKYVSDPSDPVPYYHKDSRSRDRDYMAGDQRFASIRSDVLCYTGDVLTDTLKVEGPLKVHLRVSLSTSDADFIVKLIDVRPDGYQMLVRMEAMRGRYRKSLSKPSPMKPGKKETVEWEMPDVAHYFLPGHRLMVQVQSTCFPLMALSPQFFQKNPYTVPFSQYRKTDVIIYHQKKAASWIELPVVQE